MPSPLSNGLASCAARGLPLAVCCVATPGTQGGATMFPTGVPNICPDTPAGRLDHDRDRPVPGWSQCPTGQRPAHPTTRDPMNAMIDSVLAPLEWVVAWLMVGFHTIF